MPAEKVCQKLKAKDAQICELKYGLFGYSSFFLDFDKSVNPEFISIKFKKRKKFKSSEMLG